MILCQQNDTLIKNYAIFFSVFCEKTTPKNYRKRKKQAKIRQKMKFEILCQAEVKSKFNLRKDDVNEKQNETFNQKII